mgnify:CR=1 FL=1
MIKLLIHNINGFDVVFDRNVLYWSLCTCQVVCSQTMSNEIDIVPFCYMKDFEGNFKGVYAHK